MEKGNRNRKQGHAPSSTFVTRRALLGIKSIGRNGKHVIALDADAVDDRAYDGGGLDGLGDGRRRRSGGFLRSALGGHGLILA
jgi:hypothetical protein